MRYPGPLPPLLSGPEARTPWRDHCRQTDSRGVAGLVGGKGLIVFLGSQVHVAEPDACHQVVRFACQRPLKRDLGPGEILVLQLILTPHGQSAGVARIDREDSCQVGAALFVVTGGSFEEREQVERVDVVGIGFQNCRQGIPCLHDFTGYQIKVAEENLLILAVRILHTPALVRRDGRLCVTGENRKADCLIGLGNRERGFRGCVRRNLFPRLVYCCGLTL